MLARNFHKILYMYMLARSFVTQKIHFNMLWQSPFYKRKIVNISPLRIYWVFHSFVSIILYSTAYRNLNMQMWWDGQAISIFSSVSVTEYTEWQWPLSGVHSIMMQNSSQAGEGEGGGCTPSPFHFIYHHKQSFFLFSGHEPIYFTENKEKTLRVSYDRDTHTIDYMNKRWYFLYKFG